MGRGPLNVLWVLLIAAGLCQAQTVKRKDLDGDGASINNAVDASTSSTSNTITTTTPSTPLPPAVTASGSVTGNRTNRQKLRSLLLDGYDVHTHPVTDHDDPVVVAVGLALIHLDIDESRSVMTVDAWMRLSWKDAHLTWDPKNYDDLNQIHFGVDEIWKPDILLYNSADHSGNSPYGKTHYLVSSSGEVLWVPPAHLKAFCKLDLRFWPLDTQKCKLKFGSWTSHGDQIDLQLYRNATQVERLDFYTNNREWKVLAATAEKKNVKYACCEEKYPDVTFEFFLQRDSPAYRAIIVLPCLVIMLMTICCFLLPPNAGEKMVVNGFAFVASVMYLLYFAMTLPFHESEVPIIVMFYSNTTALIGIGLLLNVTCVSMCRERKFTGPPRFLKALFAGPVGRFLCLGHYLHQVSATHQRLVVELTDMAESEQQNIEGIDGPASEASGIMRDWTLVAAGLERFFFVLYTIVFAIVTSVYV